MAYLCIFASMYTTTNAMATVLPYYFISIKKSAKITSYSDRVSLSVVVLLFFIIFLQVEEEEDDNNIINSNVYVMKRPSCTNIHVTHPFVTRTVCEHER